MIRAARVLSGAVALLIIATPTHAQRGGGRGGGGPRDPVEMPNVPYDGRFTYIRVRYDIPLNGGFRVDLKWKHDYPRGEQHFAKIMSELSTIRTVTGQSNILTFDDPKITRYPVAFICEPGFWRPSPAEVVGMRNYLLKGGFVIFDDFAGEHWMNFEEQSVCWP